MNFQILDVDTKLLGFRVAKILVQQLSPVALQSILEELRKLNVRLVYWPSDSKSDISQQAAKKLNGFLASEQVTYLIGLKKINQLPQDNLEIEAYQDKTPAIELEELAFQAGINSRFKVDPNFPNEFFYKLYRTWIANSINKTIASQVLVARRDNKIVGMITLGAKNNRGDIGLLAVNLNFRGQKLGTKLIVAALRYFVHEGFSFAQVVTQKANICACHLYEKCGFSIENIENYYHFWLS